MGNEILNFIDVMQTVTPRDSFYHSKKERIIDALKIHQYESGSSHYPVHSRWKQRENSVYSHTGHTDIQSSKANIGNPTGSGSGTPRHGIETRPRNVALMYCIKY
jgi:hypothetical protein